MMRKNFFDDIMGEGGSSQVDPENEEQSESVYVGSDEIDTETPSIEPEPEADTFLKRRSRPRVEIPTDSMAQPKIADSVLYVQARRVAELKFNFYRWLTIALPLSIFFFCMAYFEIGPSGKFWFVYPVGLIGVSLLLQYLRAFVLKGRNLHSMIEGTIHDMAMRESRKRRYRDFL